MVDWVVPRIRRFGDGYARRYSLHAEHDFETLHDFPAFREILEPRSGGLAMSAHDPRNISRVAFTEPLRRLVCGERV